MYFYTEETIFTKKYNALMFIFNEADLAHLALHKVGNKMHNADLLLSEKEINPEEPLSGLLKHWFLSSFKSEAFYHFVSTEDTENYMQELINNLFADETLFFETTREIGQWLFQKTNHSKIKSGDLFVAYFKNCVVDDELCDAIGIFKAENKDTFLKIYPQNKVFAIEAEDGINISKLDKGALIFNSESEFGYKISLVDNINKSIEAQYWRQDFLNLIQRNDEFYQTQNYMDMCKSFVQDVYNKENNIEKTEQIDLLNKTSEYFQTKEQFSLEDFQNEIIKEPEVIQAFEEYKNLFAEKHEVPLEQEFKISQEVAKKYKSKFKSVLKLDKNFHIYIHGDRSLIEKGFDQNKNLHYYKVFYEEEE